MKLEYKLLSSKPFKWCSLALLKPSEEACCTKLLAAHQSPVSHTVGSVESVGSVGYVGYVGSVESVESVRYVRSVGFVGSVGSVESVESV